MEYPDSVLGRLLDEISWEGRSVRSYRGGGRGRENVLTAEVMTALDFLPRTAFLGAILNDAHGADAARAALCAEIEHAELAFLPDEIVLHRAGRSRGEQLIVQPDASFTTPGCYGMIEAKRIRRSSFQPQQLAREYLAVTRAAEGRTPVLLLILGTPPPVPVAGAGRLSVQDAILGQLSVVSGLADRHPLPLNELTRRVDDVCAWTTWQDVATTVARQRDRLTVTDPSVAASINRLATSIVRSVARHS